MTKQISIPIAALLLATSTLSAPATTTVREEAEAYDSFYEAGGDAIHVGFCSSASEEFCADGVDKPGDWIRLGISVPAAGAYNAYIAFQGMAGSAHEYLVEIWPQGEPLSTESVVFDYVGAGVG